MIDAEQIIDDLHQTMFGKRKRKQRVDQTWAADKIYTDPKSSCYRNFASPIKDFNEFALFNHHGNFTYGELDMAKKLRNTQMATPPWLVQFANRSVEYLLHELVPKTISQIVDQLGQRGVVNYPYPFGHPSVKIADPFLGTGIFIDIVLRYHLTVDQLKSKWNNGDIQCFELDPVTAMVGAVNLELAYATITGEYRRCWFVACVDTFQVDPQTGVYKCQEDNVEYTEGEMWQWFHV